MKWIIYQAFCLKTKKSYIGQTMKSLEQRKKDHLLNALNNRGYYFHKTLRKYGSHNFEWKILNYTFMKETANKLEIKWINKLNTIQPYGYNLTYGGESGVLSEEVNRKRAELQRGRVVSEKARKLISEKNKGYRHSEEMKEYLSRIHSGVPFSEERKRKISQSNMGHLVSKETRRKLSIARKGKHLSEEHKRKISEGLKNKIKSEETRIKISERDKEFWSNPKNGKLRIKQMRESYTPEVRLKKSISAKKLWADPTFREKRRIRKEERERRKRRKIKG